MAEVSRTPVPAGIEVMTAADVQRAATRIAHEIIERNHGLDGVVLAGIQRGGVWLADQLAAAVERIEGRPVPTGSLDIAFHRDDIGLRPVVPAGSTTMPSVDGALVVLVDDVLYTGRTIRAALDALNDYGRPLRRATGGHGRPRPSRAPDPARLRG
ncbi:MAG: pyrimidine operon attenuation protein / uracil phosphoribosyltransferase [Acidimicrobiaceae bacterium]|nr:pyrimidine operon attenuation protein / uracil phosphoribosyltransferase [Acidimicrobiaceae bacterium]